jgi:hypothetical protein
LDIPPKKRRTPFYWVSKLRSALRKWLKPLYFGYTSKKEEPLFLGNRTQKNDKIFEKWKPLG